MLRKKYIYSCALGGAFFTVPYLALGIGALPCAAIGVAAYSAGVLLFNDKQKKKVDALTIEGLKPVKNIYKHKNNTTTI